jgi:hypothetical protein
MFAYFFAFASSISYGFSYLLCGFFLCTAYFGFPLHQVKSKEKVMSLMNKIKWSAMKDENNKSQWFFIGNNYIGSIESNDKGHIVYILCSSTTFKNLTEIIDSSGKLEKINIYERRGNFFWFDYDKREFTVDKYTANEEQSLIIEKIADEYKADKYKADENKADENKADENKVKKKRTVFMYGKPGAGKSMCSILLAKKLKGSLVRTFDPTDPGDNLASLYSIVNPTESNPLIIVLDEVNILYHRVFHNLIEPHKHIPIQISNKTSLNRFFDDINLGLYPYLIILMTSNMSSKEIEEKYDPSYIREGRVDLKFNLEKNIDKLNSIKICDNKTNDSVSTTDLSDLPYPIVREKKKFFRIPKFLKNFII